MSTLSLLLAGLLAIQPMPTPSGLPTPVPSAGDAALRDGTFDDAGALYGHALAQNPKEVNALVGLGTIELYRNHLKRSAQLLNDALAIDSNNRLAQARLRTISQREGAATDYRMSLHSEVDVPFIATDPLPMIHASINGHPMVFVIDTGGTNVDLSEDSAKALGLSLTQSGQGIFAGGKTARVLTAHLDTVEVGGLTIHGVPSNVIPQDMSMGDRHVDGAIGTNFLSHFLSSIDYVHGQLILRPRATAGTFEVAALANGGSVVPMWLVGDHFLFTTAQVNDAPKTLFNVDTGGGGIGVQLTRPELDAAAIPIDTTKTSSFTGGGGAARTVAFTAKTVSLGSFSQANVPGVFFPDGDQYGIFPFTVAGSLSHLFFRHSVVTFDFDTMQLTVTHG